MEPKKNARYDVHRHRAILLNVGLATSLVIVIFAFECTVDKHQPKIILERYEEPDLSIVDYPRATVIKSPEIPKPTRAVAKPIQAVTFKDATSEATESAEPKIDMGNPEPASFGFEEVPQETVPVDTFIVVEHMPEPVGGWPAFFQTLSKNVKYPKQTKHTRTTGKVFVQFTVNHRGEPGQFRILKGVGQGCDEEAMRVLALTKWNPGKQRGKPVNVRMVQPISFMLKQ